MVEKQKGRWEYKNIGLLGEKKKGGVKNDMELWGWIKYIRWKDKKNWGVKGKKMGDYKSQK